MKANYTELLLLVLVFIGGFVVLTYIQVLETQSNQDYMRKHLCFISQQLSEVKTTGLPVNLNCQYE